MDDGAAPTSPVLEWTLLRGSPCEEMAAVRCGAGWRCCRRASSPRRAEGLGKEVAAGVVRPRRAAAPAVAAPQAREEARAAAARLGRAAAPALAAAGRRERATVGDQGAVALAVSAGDQALAAAEEAARLAPSRRTSAAAPRRSRARRWRRPWARRAQLAMAAACTRGHRESQARTARPVPGPTIRAATVLAGPGPAVPPEAEAGPGWAGPAGELSSERARSTTPRAARAATSARAAAPALSAYASATRRAPQPANAAAAFAAAAALPSLPPPPTAWMTASASATDGRRACCRSGTKPRDRRDWPSDRVDLSQGFRKLRSRLRNWRRFAASCAAGTRGLEPPEVPELLWLTNGSL